MPPNPERTEETRIRIIETAERLFALHGIAGVSTRQIVQESGQKNNSAVTYHFGSTISLVRAIFRHRSSTIDADRSTLIQTMHGGEGAKTLEDLALAIIVPVVRFMQTQQPSYYLRFTRAALQEFGSRSIGVQLLFVPAYRSMMLRGMALLDPLPLRLRRARLTMVAEYYVQQLASWEATSEAADAPASAEMPVKVPLDEFAEEVIRTSVALLSAPVPERRSLLQSLLYGGRTE